MPLSESPSACLHPHTLFPRVSLAQGAPGLAPLQLIGYLVPCCERGVAAPVERKGPQFGDVAVGVVGVVACVEEEKRSLTLRTLPVTSHGHVWKKKDPFG